MIRGQRRGNDGNHIPFAPTNSQLFQFSDVEVLDNHRQSKYAHEDSQYLSDDEDGTLWNLVRDGNYTQDASISIPRTHDLLEDITAAQQRPSQQPQNIHQRHQFHLPHNVKPLIQRLAQRFVAIPPPIHGSNVSGLVHFSDTAHAGDLELDLHTVKGITRHSVAPVPVIDADSSEGSSSTYSQNVAHREERYEFQRSPTASNTFKVAAIESLELPTAQAYSSYDNESLVSTPTSDDQRRYNLEMERSGEEDSHDDDVNVALDSEVREELSQNHVTAAWIDRQFDVGEYMYSSIDELHAPQNNGQIVDRLPLPFEQYHPTIVTPPTKQDGVGNDLFFGDKVAIERSALPFDTFTPTNDMRYSSVDNLKAPISLLVHDIRPEDGESDKSKSLTVIVEKSGDSSISIRPTNRKIANAFMYSSIDQMQSIQIESPSQLANQRDQPSEQHIASHSGSNEVAALSWFANCVQDLLRYLRISAIAVAIILLAVGIALFEPSYLVASFMLPALIGMAYFEIRSIHRRLNKAVNVCVTVQRPIIPFTEITSEEPRILMHNSIDVARIASESLSHAMSHLRGVMMVSSSCTLLFVACLFLALRLPGSTLGPSSLALAVVLLVLSVLAMALAWHLTRSLDDLIKIRLNPSNHNSLRVESGLSNGSKQKPSLSFKFRL